MVYMIESYEGLSRGDNHRAIQFYARHKQCIDKIAEYTVDLERDIATNPFSSDVSRNRISTKIRSWRIERDANLWRAYQHKEEHLEQYVETALQEAKPKAFT